MFKLRVPADSIDEWARRYSEFYDDSTVEEIGRVTASNGYLSRDGFLEMARWKTPRSQPRCRQNSEAYVREVTSAALRSHEPRFKIESLRLLDGVDWPTASVMLHFCDRDKWPIIDYRAFWSLGQPSPAGNYSVEMWGAYTEFTRNLANQFNVSMRTLDRALWAYSKVKQPAGGA